MYDQLECLVYKLIIHPRRAEAYRTVSVSKASRPRFDLDSNSATVDLFSELRNLLLKTVKFMHSGISGQWSP